MTIFAHAATSHDRAMAALVLAAVLCDSVETAALFAGAPLNADADELRALTEAVRSVQDAWRAIDAQTRVRLIAPRYRIRAKLARSILEASTP